MDASFMLIVKIAASASIGLLIGLEREWAHKEIGVRSFALCALLGTLSWLVSPNLAWAQMAVIALLLVLVNISTLWKEQSLQVTTSLAVVATNILGMIVGMGNFLLAFAGGLLIAALLVWKTELITLSGRLTTAEIRGTLLLGLITAVIYPLLPDRFVDPWNLVNPRTLWLTVVIVSAVSFVNYVLLRLFGSRSIRYSALLGGFVNSAATTVIVAQETAQIPDRIHETPANVLLSDLAMIVRDSFLVFLFSLPLGLEASLSIVAVLCPMILTAGIEVLLVFRRVKRPSEQSAPHKPLLNSPLELRSVLGFGFLFLVLTTVSGLANRLFGTIGFLTVVVVGAFASAASSAVLVGQHFARAPVQDPSVVTAMFLATVMGLLENVALCGIITRNVSLAGRLFLLTLPIIGIGALVLFVTSLWLVRP